MQFDENIYARIGVEFTASIVEFWYEDTTATIFKLLLENNPDVIIKNVEFMKRCVVFYNSYYIRLAIDHGYNCNFDGSIDVFKGLIESERWMGTERYLLVLNLLLANGFDKYGQSLLLDCIKHDSYKCLQELLIRGVINLYSIKDEIHTCIEKCPMECIHIVFNNMYRIEMLTEPVCKYFLIKSIWFAGHVPNEIFVYVAKLYMEIDYAYTNNLYQNCLELELKLEEEMTQVD